MKRLIVLAAAMLAWPACALAQNPQACTLQQAASLPITTDPDGRVTVPASVDGRAVHLLVDTGGTITAIDSSIADELKMPRMRGPSQVMAGNVVMNEMAVAEKLQLGQQRAAGFTLLVMPTQTLSPNDDGLVGGSVLSKYDVEFDFAHARFNLFSQEHCPGAVVYWTKSAYAAVPMQIDREWHITVPVMLNGKPITAVIDSGAAESIMPLEVARQLFGIDMKDPKLKSIGAAAMNNVSRTAIFRYPFSSITLEGVTVNNPEIDLVPQNSMFSMPGGPQLVLGIGILRQLHVYIAYKEQVLYVTPAEAQ